MIYMVGNGLYFTMYQINDSIINQHRIYYSVKYLNSEVKRGLPVSLVTYIVLSTVAASPALCHRKFVNCSIQNVSKKVLTNPRTTLT